MGLNCDPNDILQNLTTYNVTVMLCKQKKKLSCFLLGIAVSTEMLLAQMRSLCVNCIEE